MCSGYEPDRACTFMSRTSSLETGIGAGGAGFTVSRGSPVLRYEHGRRSRRGGSEPVCRGPEVPRTDLLLPRPYSVPRAGTETVRGRRSRRHNAERSMAPPLARGCTLVDELALRP